MKLSEYASYHEIGYRAAWNRYKAGKIEGAWQDAAGTIHVPDIPDESDKSNLVAVYARVSDNDSRQNLNRQAERLVDWSVANGYTVVSVTKEMASGLNDNRTKLHHLLMKNDWGTLMVEHKDRLTRFGFRWFETLLAGQGRQVVVVMPPTNDEEELVQDLVSIVYSSTARMCGSRRAKRLSDIVRAETTSDASDSIEDPFDTTEEVGHG